jgi:hypothetical protein
MCLLIICIIRVVGWCVAYAIAGRVDIDFETEPLATVDGKVSMSKLLSWIKIFYLLNYRSFFITLLDRYRVTCNLHHTVYANSKSTVPGHRTFHYCICTVEYLKSKALGSGLGSYNTVFQNIFLKGQIFA